MTKPKEVHSDIQKFPDPQFCGDKFFAFELANWQDNTVETLEKRIQSINEGIVGGLQGERFHEGKREAYQEMLKALKAGEQPK